MRKRTAEALIALVALIAGVGIVGALTSQDPSTAGEDPVTLHVIDTTTTINPAYVQAVEAAQLQAYADAVTANQLTEYAARLDRWKAEQAETARNTAQPVPRQYVEQPASIPSGSVWDRLAQCEAGGNWQHPFVGPLPGNPGRYSGGLMFAESTWNAYGRDFAPVAHQASREQQIVVAERILASSGWGAWPACSRKLGLR